MTTPKCPDDWPPFAAEYLPVIRGWARNRFGLSEPDADDAAQEVMLRVFRYGRTFREGCDLRSWLFVVVRRECQRVRAGVARRVAAGVAGETAALDQFASPEAADGVVAAEEAAGAAAAMRAAERNVSPVAWAAFVGTAIDGRPGEDVAAELGTTSGAVWVMRWRVLAKVRVFAAGGRATGRSS